MQRGVQRAQVRAWSHVSCMMTWSSSAENFDCFCEFRATEALEVVTVEGSTADALAATVAADGDMIESALLRGEKFLQEWREKEHRCAGNFISYLKIHVFV